MRKDRGFTLVELLVVIAIVDLLASMLSPTLTKAMESARSMTCLNNLKHIGIWHDHVTQGRSSPPYCHWRLEVAAPKAEKSYFLHVFQVAGEKTRAMSPVRLVAETPEIRIEIGSGDKAWRVAFAANGALTAFVCAPGSKQGVRLKPGVAVKDQYEGQSPK